MRFSRSWKICFLLIFFALLVTVQLVGEGVKSEEEKEPIGEETLAEMADADEDEFQEGLLDRILKRGQGLPAKEAEDSSDYETFEEKLKKEKAQERLEDMENEREMESDELRRNVL